MASFLCVPIVFLAFCLAARAASADVVGGPDEQFGRIMKFERGTILILPGCDEDGPVRRISWAAVRYVVFDDLCQPHDVKPPDAEITRCDGSLIPAYKVDFGLGQTILASEISFDGTDVSARASNGDWVVDRKGAVDTILRTDRCPTSAKEDAWPPTACREPAQWAVNWSPQAVAENKIFTKGFAIHVVREGDRDDANISNGDVRLAFQTAITMWTSALFTHRAELDDHLANYVTSITARGGQTVLLSPPQVISVNCPQFATAVVTISTDAKRFPARDVVALSRIEGRSIFLNASVFRFFARLTPLDDDPPVNLVPVMTHELGHAFGLVDEQVSEQESIMAGVQSDLRRMKEPTTADVRRLAAVLRQTIVGGRPGEFQPVRCGGLRAASQAHADPSLPLKP